MTARCHPVSLPGDTEDTDTRDRIRIRIRPGKTLKLYLPEGYGVSATSTTDLEPLSDHGAPPRARRIAAAHVAHCRALRAISQLGKLNLRRVLIPESGQSCYYASTKISKLTRV